MMPKEAYVQERDEIPIWLEHEIRVREPSLARVLGRVPNPGDAMTLLHAFDRLIADQKRHMLDHPTPPRLKGAAQNP